MCEFVLYNFITARLSLLNNNRMDDKSLEKVSATKNFFSFNFLRLSFASFFTDIYLFLKVR